MNGLSATAAKTILALVAALAGSAWSMILPKGKLVPYKHATAANKSLGPRYESIVLSMSIANRLLDEASVVSSSCVASRALVPLAKDLDVFATSASTILDKGNTVRGFMASIPPSF